MPLEYRLSDSIIHFTTVGDVDYEGGLAILKEAFSRASSQPSADSQGWHLLFDITESKENRQSQEVRHIAETIQSRKQCLSGRCAVVATDPLRFGVGRMFGAFMEGLGLESIVVRSVAEAEQWLKSAESGEEMMEVPERD